MDSRLIGARATLQHRVEAKDTAAAWGNDLEVLATPVLLWLAEIACMRALENQLPPNEMTLGYSHDSRHLAPTLLGQTVQIEAELEEVDGKILHFRVKATDDQGVVFEGRHARGVVDRTRFEDKLRRKAQLNS